MFAVKYKRCYAVPMTESGPEVDDALFAANIVSIRERAGMSQAELARRLNSLGWDSVYQTTISRIEKGDRPVRVGEARLIARALNVELSTMMLSISENHQAGQLAFAREELVRAERAIRDGAEQWYLAHEQLQEVVAEIKASGIEPSDYDPPDGASLKPATAADELALAIRALERDPQLSVRHGWNFYRARKARDSKA